MKELIKIVILLFSFTLIAFGGEKKIVVDLTKQEAYAYEGDRLIYKGWISSGKKRFETPIGRYRVLQKEKEHISNKYPEPSGGAKMPYMLRLTWSGVALHAGYTPNRPASHGCIRLKKEFAKKLFKWANIGTRVIIKGKAPKWVARSGKGFIDYIALAKRKHKVYKLAKRASKSKKRYISKRRKLIRYYAKFTHKRLNRILRKIKREERDIKYSLKYSKYTKLKKLREIKRLESILRSAKSIKYKRAHYKKYVKKSKKYKKVSFNRLNYKGLKYSFSIRI